ncbi:MAG TPA: sensor histidine kinase [Gemmatimonadaceae bacterium]|jgi:signal transduction histidine kinase
MSAATNQTSMPAQAHGDSSDQARQHGVLLTRLERGRGVNTGAGDAATPAHNGLPRWLQLFLRTPLPVKLVGANVFLLVAATATALVVRHRELSTAPVLAVVIVAFLAALLLNTALVMLAVRPLRTLEKTVDDIWHGDLDARVPTSVLADRHVTRVSRMFNILLDGLVADRARTRRLATEVITAGDRERAVISRELHDSVAQSLAALVMQLSVGVQSADDAPREVLKTRIAGARLLAINTLEEIRLLAHTMHPRVLDDLGLVAALKRLARDTTDHLANYTDSTDAGGAVVEVTAAAGSDEAIPAPVVSVLYRVAQEAVQNARRHASPKRVEIRFLRDLESATIEIVDDGRGFDPDALQGERAGIGLFTMQERVALVDGELQIRSQPGGGTSVLASVPLRPVANPPLSGPDT